MRGIRGDARQNLRLLKASAIASLALSLAGCDWFGPPTHTVQRVSDGDTIAVIDPQGNALSIRFACIDAPEVPHSAKERQSRKAVDKSQFKWGEQAQTRVQELVNAGGDRVVLTITDSDRYGRKIGEVRLRNGTFIQEVLVSEGLALVYRPYLKNCPSAALIEAAEATAKSQKKGVWQDPKFVVPWEYRRL
ncbi:MAG: thermonuclease family protein [Desertifilum sp.]|nr:thermonuclease family protein [Desertifilum sp.]